MPDAGSLEAALPLRPAGLGMTMVGLEQAQTSELRKVLADLTADGSAPSRPEAPAWTIRCAAAPLSWFSSPAQASAGEEFWEYFLDLDAAREDSTLPVRVAGLDFFALLHRAPVRRLEVWLPEDLAGGRLEQATHNLLRVATAFAVTDAGGLLLHSSAILAGEGPSARAVVCPGRSGAGKSTLSALAQRLGWQILSDELNVVWIGTGELGTDLVTVEQVPFTGDLGRLHRRPGRFPVAGVLPLVRTGRDERPHLSPAQLYARVLAEAVFVNSDPQSAPRLERTVERLVRWAGDNDRSEALSFTPDGRLDALRPLLDRVERGARVS